MNRQQTWDAIHAERAALARDLADLSDDQWITRSLCADWSIREVVAHLTAGALETRWRWLASVIRARGDFETHNRRRLSRHLGDSPRETLDRFDRARTSTTAPSGHHWGWLGEIVIHGEDIRRPLGITAATPPRIAEEVAIHFSVKDFTVPSRSHVRGLHLRATDSSFDHGEGAEVTGPTLSLLMAMAGRAPHLADLRGDGVAHLAAAIN